MMICKSEKWAMNVKKCEPRSLAGVVDSSSDKSIYDSTCNMLDVEFGRAALAINAVSNIISQSTLVDRGWTVKYDQRNDIYTIVNPKNKKKYTFGRVVNESNGFKHRYYIMDMHRGQPPIKQSEHVLLGTTIGVPTVTELKSKYTKKQIKHADLALEFMKRMTYPTKEVAIDQTRTIKNCPITAEDIHIAYDIYGKSIAQLRGTTVKRTAPSATYEPINEDVIVNQIAEVDLFFVRKRVYLAIIFNTSP